MLSGTKHMAEQIVNLYGRLRLGCKREDLAAGVQRSRARGTDLLTAGERKFGGLKARRIKELDPELTFLRFWRTFGDTSRRVFRSVGQR